MAVGKEAEWKANVANEKLWAEFQRRRRAARLQEVERFTPTESARKEAMLHRSLSPERQREALNSSPEAPGALARAAAVASPTNSGKQKAVGVTIPTPTVVSPASNRKQKAGGSEIQQLLAAVQLERNRQQAPPKTARASDTATLRRSASYPNDKGRSISPRKKSERDTSTAEGRRVSSSPRRLANIIEGRQNGREMDRATSPPRQRRRPPVAASTSKSGNSTPASTRGGNNTSKEAAASELGKSRDLRSSAPSPSRAASPGSKRSKVEHQSSYVDEEELKCAERRRTLELPSDFGNVSQQQFAARLRGVSSASSLNTSLASGSKGACTELAAAWDSCTVCPRSFNGFWGPDAKATVPVRAASQPRMLGPGQTPVPSKELVKWHLTQATNLLKFERRPHE